MILSTDRTEKQTYFSQLDGLRFFAVAAVMFGHWADVEALDTVKKFMAASGVNLFFVLSGFLITGILIRSKLADDQSDRSQWFSIRQFYIRRSLRIFPIYYLVVLIGFISGLEPTREILPWLLTYTTNIYWSTGGSLGAYGHLWSLAVEEQFYLFFPFVIMSLPVSSFRKAFFGMILLAVAGRLLTYFMTMDTGNHVGVYALMPNCLDSFCIGSLLAFHSIFDKEKLRRILQYRLLFVSALLLFILCYLMTEWRGNSNLFVILFSRFFFSVCCFWLIGVSVTKGFKGLTGKMLENKWISYLGRISYGLYLYHHFMPELCGYLLEKAGMVLPYSQYYEIEKPLLFFAMTLLVSVVSWHLIEAPINGLKRHFNYKEK